MQSPDTYRLVSICQKLLLGMLHFFRRPCITTFVIHNCQRCDTILFCKATTFVSYECPLHYSSFRMFSNEDVTIGSWMLAMNVNHENNQLLCASDCTPSFIAVWDIPKCSGLCDPEKRLVELHQKESCSRSPTMPADDD